MNPELLRHRLAPRSNRTTNLLFAVTFLVFALVAETAMDQQQATERTLVDHAVEEADGPGHALVLAWRITDLIPPLQF
jgi:hypothetical protein